MFAFAGSAIQLVPDGTILFHLLLIVVMVSLLNVTLLKPLNRILAERERRTKGGSEEARATLANADEKLRPTRIAFARPALPATHCWTKNALKLCGDESQRLVP